MTHQEILDNPQFIKIEKFKCTMCPSTDGYVFTGDDKYVWVQCGECSCKDYFLRKDENLK